MGPYSVLLNGRCSIGIFTKRVYVRPCGIDINLIEKKIFKVFTFMYSWTRKRLTLINSIF